MDYKGHIDDAFKFIENFDLLRPELWERFVNQFRINPDDEDRGRREGSKYACWLPTENYWEK